MNNGVNDHGYSEENYQNHQKDSKNTKNTSNKTTIRLNKKIIGLLLVFLVFLLSF